MQEWIIAMLVVSILLILRDMAKTVFSGRTQEKEGCSVCAVLKVRVGD